MNPPRSGMSLGSWSPSGQAVPSPPVLVSLRKRQCSSLMKCPLRTMSCLFSASSRPTLPGDRQLEPAPSFLKPAPL